MTLKDDECFELLMADQRNVQSIAETLLNENYDVQMAPVYVEITKNHGLARKYLLTIRRGTNKTDYKYETRND